MAPFISAAYIVDETRALLTLKAMDLTDTVNIERAMPKKSFLDSLIVKKIRIYYNGDEADKLIDSVYSAGKTLATASILAMKGTILFLNKNGVKFSSDEVVKKIDEKNFEIFYSNIESCQKSKKQKKMKSYKKVDYGMKKAKLDFKDNVK